MKTMPLKYAVIIPVLLASLGAVARADNSQADDYINQGDVKYVNKDYDGAIADYTRAIKIDPNIAFAYNARCLVKRKKGDYEGAIADCTRAIQLNPNNDKAYDDRGTAEYAKGSYGSAIADWKRGIELNPSQKEHYQSKIDKALAKL